MPFWRSQTDTDLAGSVNKVGQLPSVAGKRHLPQPRGPHSVGYIELMTPGEPGVGSLVRFLYPTNEQCLTEYERWPVWQDDNYLKGTLTFLQAMLERWPSWATRNEYLGIDKLEYVSPFIPHYGFPTLCRLFNGTVHVPIIKDAVPDSSKQRPLIIFSHGLGCAITTYSRICYDLASFGFVVAAVEHRDGTACHSYFYDKDDKEVHIQHKKVMKGDDEYSIRNKQVQQRRKEVSNVLDLIQNFKENHTLPRNLIQDSPNNILRQVFTVTDHSRPVISGHSFGGATTILTLLQDSRFCLGIALDTWGFPLRDECLKEKSNKPLLLLSTDYFRTNENLEKLSELQSWKNKSENESCQEFYYIKGSVHQNHLDTAFIVSHFLVKKILGLDSETCPEIILDLNNKKMVQFIWKHLGMGNDEEVDEDLKKMDHLLMDLFEE